MDASVCELLVKAYLSCNQAITAGRLNTPPLGSESKSDLALSIALPILPPERDLPNGVLSNMQNPRSPFHADRLVFLQTIGQHGYVCFSNASPWGRPRSTLPQFTIFRRRPGLMDRNSPPKNRYPTFG